MLLTVGVVYLECGPATTLPWTKWGYTSSRDPGGSVWATDHVPNRQYWEEAAWAEPGLPTSLTPSLAVGHPPDDLPFLVPLPSSHAALLLGYVFLFVCFLFFPLENLLWPPFYFRVSE